MQLNGFHHVTAISGQISANATFYTKILGLRLVKRSVNQDDLSAYHLYYADKVGTPGTDMTFFDWPQMDSERRGTDSIVATVFRVAGPEALAYWIERFDRHKVHHHGLEHFAGQGFVRFEDPEGQRLALMDDGGAPYEGVFWEGGEVPAVYALRGFYAAMLSTPRLSYLEPILTQVLAYRKTARHRYPGYEGEVVVYEMGEGGAGRQVWVMEEADGYPARQGAGGVHHVAFRVADQAEQRAWRARITSAGLPVSQLIDRFYFHSIYFRISNGILFEIATDGPGFTADEDVDSLGTQLALPPFLEGQRAQIEAGLKPITIK